MKVLITCCAILACVAFVSADDVCTDAQYLKYLEFKEKFGKKGLAINEIEKCTIWAKSVAEVDACNANKEIHDCEINKMSDMTASEKRQFLGYKIPTPNSKLFKLRAGSDQAPTITPAEAAALPASVDWRTKGYVSPVKNQGNCGSCWTFATTGVLESAVYAKYKQKITLSEQQLADCVYKQQNGCDGGWMLEAFQYIKKSGGLYKSSAYAYFSGNKSSSGVCKFKAGITSNIGVKVDSAYAIPSGDQLALKYAVATTGPVAVAVDADDWFNYKSGVYTYPACRNNFVNHAVLIVGYGTTSDGVDYWIVKNSWGVNWGEKGYILVPRDVPADKKKLYSECSITKFASFATAL